jgi:CRP-like cAMP-binding protein
MQVTMDQAVDVIGYAAAATVFATYSMKTMIPLRIIGIASNALFILYGYLAGAVPVLVLHLVLLPLNAWRLRQMVVLVSKVRQASAGDLSIGWLRPFMRSRDCERGDVLFNVGDHADCMFYVVSGSFRLVELDLRVLPGGLIGEIGLVSPGNRRTLTFVCDEPGELLVMDYTKVRELYFQNPQFGFYLLRLVGERLVRNMVVLNERAESAWRSSFGDFEPAAPARAAPADRVREEERVS